MTRGFVSGAAAGDADHSDYSVTEVRYAPGAKDKAKVVASYLGGVGSVVPMTTESQNADVAVVLGRDFVAVVAPGQHPQSTSDGHHRTRQPRFDAGIDGAGDEGRASGRRVRLRPSVPTAIAPSARASVP